ncbi:MAG: hypothetical protein AAGG68_10870 [Bacteroidota bacterium]
MRKYYFLSLFLLSFSTLAFSQDIHELKLKAALGLQYEWINAEKRSWTFEVQYFQEGAERTAAGFELFREKYLRFALGKRLYLTEANTGWFFNPMLHAAIRLNEDVEYLDELALRYGTDFERKYANAGLGGVLGYKKVFRNGLVFDLGFSNDFIFQYINETLIDESPNNLRVSNDINAVIYLGYRF